MESRQLNTPFGATVSPAVNKVGNMGGPIPPMTESSYLSRREATVFRVESNATGEKDGSVGVGVDASSRGNGSTGKNIDVR